MAVLLLTIVILLRSVSNYFLHALLKPFFVYASVSRMAFYVHVCCN